ncbi:hypothetical protein C8R43DRAFT_1236084 [Mycena crocata]|nr:hypothetical protein C8R43DRAFT_1236084 [Mycena crocata]
MSPDGYCDHELNYVLTAWYFRGPTTSNRMALLKSVAKFLTVPRSQEERAAIKARLLTCTCDGQDNPEGQLMVTLGEVLFVALNSQTPGKFHLRKKKIRRDAQPWPLSVEDLFPGAQGPEGALRALVGWAELAPGLGGYGPFTAMAAFIRFWEPFGREVFRQPLSSLPLSGNFGWATKFVSTLKIPSTAASSSGPYMLYTELLFVSERIIPLLGSSFLNARFWFQTIIDFQSQYAEMANPNVRIIFSGEQGHEGMFACIRHSEQKPSHVVELFAIAARSVNVCRGMRPWNDYLSDKTPDVAKCQSFDALCRDKNVDLTRSDSIRTQIEALQSSTMGRLTSVCPLFSSLSASTIFVVVVVVTSSRVEPTFQ